PQACWTIIACCRARQGSGMEPDATPSPMRAMSALALVELGRLRRVDTGLAERGLERVVPVAVLERLLEGLVQELADFRAVLAVADAVTLLGERLSDDLQLIGVLRGVAEQNCSVRCHRVDRAVEHLVDAFGVGVEAARLGSLGLDVVEGGRPGHRADL